MAASDLSLDGAISSVADGRQLHLHSHRRQDHASPHLVDSLYLKLPNSCVPMGDYEVIECFERPALLWPDNSAKVAPRVLIHFRNISKGPYV